MRRPVSASGPNQSAPLPTLFDDFVRTDATPARHQEGSFAFLNRIATPWWSEVRDRLDLWFGVYCVDASREKAADLRARFRERDARQHLGAWWELYVYWLLRSLYLAKWIEVEPERDGARRPDFRVAPHEGARRADLWVEAVTTFSGIVEVGRHGAREAYVQDTINELQSANFRLWITFRAVGDNLPRKREITGPLEAWLGSLDRHDVVSAWHQRVRRRTVLKPRGWEIVLEAIPKATPGVHPNDRLIGVGPMSVGFVNDKQKAREAILEKGRRYDELAAPFVGAVMPSSPFFGLDDAAEALFGSEGVQVDPERPTGEARVVRIPDGAWSKPRGEISAVLFGPGIFPYTAARVWPQLWLNPYAKRPLGAEFPRVPRVEVDQAGLLESRDPDEAPARLLGLSQEWPGGGDPFAD